MVEIRVDKSQQGRLPIFLLIITNILLFYVCLLFLHPIANQGGQNPALLVASGHPTPPPSGSSGFLAVDTSIPSLSAFPKKYLDDGAIAWACWAASRRFRQTLS